MQLSLELLKKTHHLFDYIQVIRFNISVVRRCDFLFFSYINDDESIVLYFQTARSHAEGGLSMRRDGAFQGEF